MVESAMARMNPFFGGAVSASVIDAIVESARSMFDEVNAVWQCAEVSHPAALDLVMDRQARTQDDELRTIFVQTLRRWRGRRL